jgi:hypothetical protein
MTTDAEVEAFVHSFEDCSLPRPEWTHGKHLLVALWYTRNHGREKASELMRSGILRYIEVHGARKGGYHETITRAWIAVIERFLNERGRDGQLPVSTLAAELLADCGNQDYLLQFYSKDRLDSQEARRAWIEPDLCPIE